MNETLNLELQNGIRINKVKVSGIGYVSSDGKHRDIFKMLDDIIYVLKTEKDLGKLNIDIDVSSTGSYVGNKGTYIYGIALEDILYITNENDKIVYCKYEDGIF